MNTILVTYDLDVPAETILSFFESNKELFSDSFTISEINMSDLPNEDGKLGFRFSSKDPVDFYTAGMIGYHIEYKIRNTTIAFDYSLNPDQSTEN